MRFISNLFQSIYLCIHPSTHPNLFSKTMYSSASVSDSFCFLPCPSWKTQLTLNDRVVLRKETGLGQGSPRTPSSQQFAEKTYRTQQGWYAHCYSFFTEKDYSITPAQERFTRGEVQEKPGITFPPNGVTWGLASFSQQ